MPILDVSNLSTRFHTRNGVVHAVEDVSFQVDKGETLGIVGESGSGKSVTCYSLLGLIPTPPGKIHSGKAIFDGIDLLQAKEKELRKIRGKRISCDEPTTALDVTVQKQVLDLIKERQNELGTAVVLITHDLAVVKQTCDHVNVMYSGRIVESATADKLFANPMHAYTRALLHSIPATHKKGDKLFTIPGLPPVLTDPPKGCAFAPRNTLGDNSLCIEDHHPALAEKAPQHFVQDCPGCLT